MKTQLTRPARHKARYTEEYKQEALKLWRASGRSAAKVAAELGIRAPLLYRWAHLEREPKSKSECGTRRSIEELEAEIRRLRAENAKLLEQREALKNRWASSAKRRPKVCPNRTDERSTQSSLVMRCTPGLAQRLLRLEEASALDQDRDNWRTLVYENVFEKSLLAVVRLMAAHGWLAPWVAREGATASPGSCA